MLQGANEAENVNKPYGGSLVNSHRAHFSGYRTTNGYYRIHLVGSLCNYYWFVQETDFFPLYPWDLAQYPIQGISKLFL